MSEITIAAVSEEEAAFLVADSPGSKDFAVLVQKQAVEALEAGSLRITAQHGLQAQALIDRRIEKQADRDLALNMARLLSGSIAMPPHTVIEGRAIDVTALLAPPEVVEVIDGA